MGLRHRPGSVERPHLHRRQHLGHGHPAAPRGPVGAPERAAHRGRGTVPGRALAVGQRLGGHADGPAHGLWRGGGRRPAGPGPGAGRVRSAGAGVGGGQRPPHPLHHPGRTELRRRGDASRPDCRDSGTCSLHTTPRRICNRLILRFGPDFYRAGPVRYHETGGSTAKERFSGPARRGCLTRRRVSYRRSVQPRAVLSHARALRRACRHPAGRAHVRLAGPGADHLHRGDLELRPLSRRSQPEDLGDPYRGARLHAPPARGRAAPGAARAGACLARARGSHAARRRHVVDAAAGAPSLRSDGRAVAEEARRFLAVRGRGLFVGGSGCTDRSKSSRDEVADLVREARVAGRRQEPARPSRLHTVTWGSRIMALSCRTAARSSLATLGGHAPEADRLELEEHLSFCVRCGQEHESLTWVRQLRNYQPDPLSSHARDNIQRALFARTVTPGKPRPRLVWPLAMACAGVAVAAVVGLTTLRQPPYRLLGGDVVAASGNPKDASAPVRFQAVAGGRVSLGMAVADLARNTELSWVRSKQVLTLVHGAVTVDVAHQNGRHFKVRASGFTVEVVGTQFTVEPNGVTTERGGGRGRAPDGRLI